jgi:hypothetical protein
VLVGLPSRSMIIRDLLMVPLPPSPLGLRPHVSRDDCITPQLRQHPLPLGEHSALLHELPAQAAALALELRQRRLCCDPAAHREYRSA